MNLEQLIIFCVLMLAQIFVIFFLILYRFKPLKYKLNDMDRSIDKLKSMFSKQISFYEQSWAGSYLSPIGHKFQLQDYLALKASVSTVTKKLAEKDEQINALQNEIDLLRYNDDEEGAEDNDHTIEGPICVDDKKAGKSTGEWK